VVDYIESVHNYAHDYATVAIYIYIQHILCSYSPMCYSEIPY